MAKKKTEVETKTYCDHCEHYGDTKVCDKCITVFNEETQECLTPTRYKHVEAINPLPEGLPCADCRYVSVNQIDDPCRECIENFLVQKKAINFLRAKVDPAPKPEEDPVPKFVDNVNHPHHYEGSTSIECIQAMTLIFGEDTVADFCACNAFKYMWRYKNKNGMEDLKKAEWYLNKIDELGEKYAEGIMPGYFPNTTVVYRRLRMMLDELLKKETEK